MSILIIEFKARCAVPEQARAVLVGQGAVHAVTERQLDTYFSVPRGRLKLRQAAAEQTLIYYERADEAGPKASEVRLVPLAAPEAEALRDVLSAALGVWQVVDKRREIYYDGNVKLHLDAVEGLGTFVEVEAIDRAGTRDAARLRAQCTAYLVALGVRPGDLVQGSYSDLLPPR